LLAAVTVRRSTSMKVDSLYELESAFAEWRRKKTHAREPMPEELRARAQRATKKHGVTAVVRVTRVERQRLFGTQPGGAKGALAPRATPKGMRSSAPRFSRLALSAPSASSPRPVAEVERSGVTLRVFEPTPEMMRLLSAACDFGAAR
jgi:hypothetical protein